MEMNVLTVTQLNFYIKSLLDSDKNLTGVYLSGEISNFTNHYRSGHFYFSLKDDKCAIKCVMFSTNARRVRFLPADGMHVLVRGRVSVYEASGQYQLYVEDMQPEGLGALHLALEQLKARLEAEGLFAQERKRPLPAFPQRVGVITSPTGAAIRDIENILGRRYPLAQVVVCPVLVQGEGAAAQLAEAVRRFNAQQAADVLIIGRGGGSLEDLWAFNEEPVVRAVAASQIPVISAVGHETDFTLCDFAADLRAPTPSAAAELAVPDSAELLLALRGAQTRMASAVQAKLSTSRAQLERLQKSRVLTQPDTWLGGKRQMLDGLAEKLSSSYSRLVGAQQQRLSACAGKLDALSPLRVLGRGYAIAQDQNGNVVRRVAQTVPGDRLHLRVSDGVIQCRVEQIEEMEHGGEKDE